MFRRTLRSSFLLLMAVFVAAGRAHAGVADVEDMTMTVTFARSSVSSDDFTVEIRVTGTGLNNGTLTVPSAPGTPVNFTQDGDDLVITDDFASQVALDAVLTNGNYTLRINNNTIQATIPYVRPNVPSPAISQPSAGDTVAPGPVEVLFTPCPVCNFSGDSVEAVLEDDAMVVLDEETLDESSESWIPDDGMGGDFLLPAQSAFVTRIVHTAVREDNISTNDDDNLMLFSGVFVQSDEVDFETGFAPPSGDFCLAANHPAPPVGCETLTDPLLQLLDPSGAIATQVDGHDVDVTLMVEPSGTLTGTASADLDDNASNETGPSPIKGKLGGSEGEASSKLSFSLENEGLLAKLKVSLTDAFSIPGNQLDRLQRASGSINGVKFKEEDSSSGPLPTAPLGWVLEYHLAADGTTVEDAVLTLEGGRTFPLTGANKFNFSSNQSSLKLSSDPKGVSVQLKKLGLDDTTDPMQITEGDVSYRALGQSGRASLGN